MPTQNSSGVTLKDMTSCLRWSKTISWPPLAGIYVYLLPFSEKLMNLIFNSHKILPLENIKIYTVGIGSLSGGLVPFNFWWVTQYQQIPPLNESALRQIADITHGKFFRATDNQTFSQIFDELSKLDKHDIKVDAHKEYATAYKPFVYILLISLLLFTLTNLILFKD